MPVKAFRITQAAWLMHDCGIRFHGFGVLKDGATGARLFNYYKVDSVTPEQKAAILAVAPDTQFYMSGPSYAPEIRAQMVCFPKAAWYRREKARANANP
jgi:hypothetical protein